MQLDESAVIWDRRDGDDAPVLVLLHGRGSNELDFAGLAPLLDGVWTTASVRAVIAEGAGFSWFVPGIPGDPPQARTDEAADAVLAWIASLPPARTLGVLGFSQGGAMALQLLRRDPARIAFAINLAGFVVRGEEPGDPRLRATRPPVFFGRGADDTVIPAEAGLRTEAWLADHADATIRVYPGLGHSLSPEELADVVAFLDVQAA